MNVWGRGVLLAVSATVLMVLSTAAAPVALAAKHKPKGLTLSSFVLKGSHGYKLQVGSYREGRGPVTAEVIAKRGDLSASYQTTGHGGLGIHTNLGSVGRVEVHFHRRERSVERVSKRCRLIVETGVFRGEIEFEGEGGYTQATAHSARGEVLRLPDGFCIFENLKSPALPSFLDTTTLSARSRTANGSIEFEVSRFSEGEHLVATATLKEKVGAVKISRTAEGIAPEKTLKIKPGKSAKKARLKLPSPFSGEAEFQDPADGPPTWIGSLGVSLPGAPAVALAGEGFAARLCVDQGVFESCKAELPPAEMPPEPQL